MYVSRIIPPVTWLVHSFDLNALRKAVKHGAGVKKRCCWDVGTSFSPMQDDLCSWTQLKSLV